MLLKTFPYCRLNSIVLRASVLLCNDRLKTHIGSEYSIEKPDALIIVDGRQSQHAATIQRGLCRMLKTLGFVCLVEFPLKNNRRADTIALGPSGEVWIAEIKSSIADFRADQKWPEYKEYCDYFFFAVASDMPVEILPDDTGLIIADRYGAEIMREAPEHRLVAARRKALMLRFARSAAQRLQGFTDPGAG
jgi:hypothetical protein